MRFCPGDVPLSEQGPLLRNVVAICLSHMAKDTFAAVTSTVGWGIKTSIFCFSHAWLITMQGQFSTISFMQQTSEISFLQKSDFVVSQWKNLLGFQMINKLLTNGKIYPF